MKACYINTRIGLLSEFLFAVL